MSYSSLGAHQGHVGKPHTSRVVLLLFPANDHLLGVPNTLLL